MKNLLFLLLVLYANYNLPAQNSPDPNFHLYLLIGQSNMAGRGKVDALSEPNNSRILMLSKNNEWLIAKDPLHFDRPKAVGVGPGLSFARKMLSGLRNRKVKIGLIPCAVGGSPIEVWSPGKEFTGVHPYDDAIERLNFALHAGVLKGIIWHQGESNANEAKSKLYLKQLEELTGRLRKEIGNDKIPFVAGELGYYRPNYSFINQALENLPQTVKYAGVASAEGLTHNGDSTHFNTASARILGERMALQMQKLQQREKKEGRRWNIFKKHRN